MNCCLCDAPAIGQFTPDIDVKGVPFCEKHKTEIQLHMLILEEDPKAIDRLIKKYKSKKK